LAKEAKVMSDDVFTLSLVLPGFSVDFDVKIQSSIEWTRSFDSCGPDFVFAVAEIWLRIGDSRHLLDLELYPGNMIEELKLIGERLRNPISLQGIEKIIPCGGWSVWMAGYWNRIDAETTTIEDERICDLLIPMSFIDSGEGHIAAYKYNGMSIIEAGTRPETKEEKPIYVWAVFDPEKIAEEVRGLRQSMIAKLLPAIKRNEPTSLLSKTNNDVGSSSGVGCR
jgi:hypothetical protein